MNRSYAKVEGSSTLIRDLHTGAIINTDEGGYKAYIAQKTAAQKRKEEIESMKDDINSLKSDLSDIKQLLQKILEK